MYFNGGIIPLFLLINTMGIYNTMWALIFRGSYFIFYIILVKAYFGTISESLKESATIDGANHYQTLWHVVLPIAKPIIAVIALYSIIMVWNSWFWAALFTTDSNIQPLQLYLRRILVLQSIDLAQDLATAEEIRAQKQNIISNSQLKYTVIVFATAPMLIMYPFFQKYFVKGVMLGSLKE